MPSPFQLINYFEFISYPVYVNVNPGSSVSLMVMTSGGASYMWKMKISQIDCKRDSDLVGKSLQRRRDGKFFPRRIQIYLRRMYLEK